MLTLYPLTLLNSIITSGKDYFLITSYTMRPEVKFQYWELSWKLVKLSGPPMAHLQFPTPPSPIGKSPCHSIVIIATSSQSAHWIIQKSYHTFLRETGLLTTVLLLQSLHPNPHLFTLVLNTNPHTLHSLACCAVSFHGLWVNVTRKLLSIPSFGVEGPVFSQPHNSKWEPLSDRLKEKWGK